MNYLLWGLLIIFVILVWFRVNKRFYNDLLSPFNLLLIGWIVPLLLGRMHLSSWQKFWSAEISFVLGFVAFGLVATSLLFNRHTCRLEPPSSRAVFAGTVRLFQNRRFLALVCILYAISFSAYVKNEFINNPVGIPLITYLNNPTLSRDAFHLWGITNETAQHSVRLFQVPLQLLVGMLYFGFRVNSLKRIKYFLLTLVIMFPIMCLLKLSRIDLVFACVAMGFVEYYYRRLGMGAEGRRKPTRATVKKWARVAVVTIVVSAAASVGMNNFHRVRNAFTTRHMAGNMVGIYVDVPDAFYAVTVEGYAFFALPFENFVNFYESYTGGYNVGIGFFRPLLSLSGQGRLADQMIANIGFSPLFGYINTAPFITIIYPELGLAGVLIVPIIYALFVNMVYVRFRKSPTFGRLFIYINVSGSWMLMSSTVDVFNLSCYINILFLVVLEMMAAHFFKARKRFAPEMERVVVPDRERWRERIAQGLPEGGFELGRLQSSHSEAHGTLQSSS